MANDMFSRNYTALDQSEKDVVQRTYYNVGQILDFLSNPLPWVQKKSRWQNLKTNLKDKVKPNP